MREENNEKGSTAEMKIKIKITLLTTLQAVGEICLSAYLSGHNIMYLIQESQFSASAKGFTALLWDPLAMLVDNVIYRAAVDSESKFLFNSFFSCSLRRTTHR